LYFHAELLLLGVGLSHLTGKGRQIIDGAIKIDLRKETLQAVLFEIPV
jgi:hypothetical protein